MDRKTTLVDVTESDEWDIYIGRARRKAVNKKLRRDHPFTAPYFPHGGHDDWRERAAKSYRRHLILKIQDKGKLAEFEALRGLRLGVWSDFGLELGQVVVDLLHELERWSPARLLEDYDDGND